VLAIYDRFTLWKCICCFSRGGDVRDKAYLVVKRYGGDQ